MPVPSEFAEGASPPIPAPHPLSQFFWEAAREHRLSLLRCQACGHFVHYPRPMCDQCQSTNLAPEDISGLGTLYSYTTVMQAGSPYFLDKVPYVVGIVEIDEEPGVRLPTGIDANEDSLFCGMRLEVFFKDVTETLTLPYFRSAQGGNE
jgi:uncharacterized protein